MKRLFRQSVALQKIRQRLPSTLLLILYIFTTALVLPFFAPSPPKASADLDTFDEMCLPPLTELDSDPSSVETGDSQGDGIGEHFKPKGNWLRVIFVNRATIKVVVDDGGEYCAYPANLPMSQIAKDEPSGSFVDLLSTTVYDPQIGNNFDYRKRTGDRNQEKDETTIDNFQDYPDNRKIGSGLLGVLSDDEIRTLISRAEIMFGIENDDVPSINFDNEDKCNFPTDDNNNAILRKEYEDTGTVGWYCLIDGEDKKPYTGLNIYDVVEDIDKFNIVYAVKDDGNVIEHVAEEEKEEWNLEWCGENNDFYRTDCDDDKSYTIERTKAEMLAEAENDNIVVDMLKEGDVKGQVRIAGENTEAAQSSSEDSAIADNGGAATIRDNCESAADFAFSFVLCPILELMDKAISWLDNRIINALAIDNNYYEDKNIQDSWGNIRNIAYIILIPVMLVMVIGTALQFSFMDPYTVKRALPRLALAVIFIALSYDICRIMIEITNVVGYGIGGIIAQPFGGFDSLRLTTIFNPSGVSNAVFAGGVLGALTISFFSGVTIWTLFSFLGVGALVLLIIFILLAVRQLLIIFMLVISPIAIISWIFPGNDKLWKLWWNTFSKMLLLYPLIMALLATGRGFASIVKETGSDGQYNALVTTIVRLVAFIGPYFFIPKAFQMAGGAFANLAGMVNDRSRGLFDRQKKWRAEQRKAKRGRIKTGRGVRENGLLGRHLSSEQREKLNTRGARMASVGDVMRDGGGLGDLKSRTNAVMAAAVKHEREEILKDVEVSAWIGNDNASGLASDVMLGNREGLRSAMAKTFNYTGNDLDARVDNILEMYRGGNTKGALTEAFAMADQESGAFNGDTAFIDTTTAQIMRAKSQYSDEALAQSMVLKAQAGGTYYEDAMDTWRASTLANHGDMNARADMTIEGRKLLMAAGRADSGAASFGASLGIQNDIEKAMTSLATTGVASVNTGMKDASGKAIMKNVHSDDELRQTLNKRLTNTIIDQNGAGVLSHQSMKTGYIEANVIPVVQERLQQAYDTHGADSAEYKAEVASAESLWKSLAATKPEMMKTFGDNVLAYDPAAKRALTSQEQDMARQQYDQADSAYLQAYSRAQKDEKSGKTGAVEHFLQSNVRPTISDYMTTVRTEVNRFSNDGVYQNYQYQYQQAEASARNQAAAAAAAAGSPGGAPVAPQVNPRPGA